MIIVLFVGAIIGYLFLREAFSFVAAMFEIFLMGVEFVLQLPFRLYRWHRARITPAIVSSPSRSEYAFTGRVKSVSLL